MAQQVAAQGERRALWAPVAMGFGCAAYFALPKEPLPWAGWVALALAAGLFLAGRRVGPGLAALLLLGACGLGGFGLAKLRTEAVRAPVAASAGRPAWVDAWVEDVASPGESGPRLLLAPIRISDWPAEATPIRVRVTLDPDMAIPAPGTAVRLLAILNPPPPPASPGAYDFARDAWFESVGGVGLALRAPETALDPPPAPWRLKLSMRINAARWRMTQAIVSALGPEEGGLAAAMTTGHEAYIPKQQVDDLRAAGLAHIISISGLHMAIVGGFAFGAVRLGIAAWPRLALRVHGKKAAAACAMLAVIGYLVLSGAPPPAQRAAITAGVAFLAILADRQAISLHALALAALAILVLRPEAVTEPGFQMSFAATAALVALAESLPRPVREISVPWPIRVWQAAVTWVGGSIAVSFVAGLATGPFAIQHFNRVSTWGLAANLAVAPISSFVMMPALALGAALAPLGLGQAPLQVAGWSIGLMNRIAAMTAAAPFAQVTVASAPEWVLPVSFAGLLVVCLWRGRLRWLGLAAATAIAWTPRPAVPLAWAAADGAAVAVRDGPTAILMRPDARRFAAELWARRRGLTPAAADDPVRDAHYDCDRASCLPRPNAPVRLAAAWNARRALATGRAEGLCGAEIVIQRNDDPLDCTPSLRLTGEDFARGGSAEIYRSGAGWRIVWAQDVRGRRPWTWGYDPR